MLGSPYLSQRGESGEKRTEFPCLFWYEAACCVQQCHKDLTFGILRTKSRTFFTGKRLEFYDQKSTTTTTITTIAPLSS